MGVDEHHALIIFLWPLDLWFTHAGPQGKRCPEGVADGTIHKKHVSISSVKHARDPKGFFFFSFSVSASFFSFSQR